MTTKKKQPAIPQFGKQPPQYRFFLNPYQDMRCTKCPQCDAKMHQRKLPLVIHIEPCAITFTRDICTLKWQNNHALCEVLSAGRHV